MQKKKWALTDELKVMAPFRIAENPELKACTNMRKQLYKLVNRLALPAL